MIVELAAMMTERLLLFKAKRNRLPERIVVFRDGVSEGQFVTVLREECKSQTPSPFGSSDQGRRTDPKFLDAFKRVGGAGTQYRPKLTMIICGKRHHTRFYPTTNESADHLGNPKPGTVVDRGVTVSFNNTSLRFSFILGPAGNL